MQVQNGYARLQNDWEEGRMAYLIQAGPTSKDLSWGTLSSLMTILWRLFFLYSLFNEANMDIFLSQFLKTFLINKLDIILEIAMILLPTTDANNQSSNKFSLKVRCWCITSFCFCLFFYESFIITEQIRSLINIINVL